jgi:hypothetical protein
MYPKRFHLLAVALIAMGLAMSTSTPARAAVGGVYGPYIYVDAGSGNLCMNDPNSSKSNVTMIVYTCQGSASNERWDNKSAVTTSDFQTINVSSDRCLTVQNASTARNAAIIQYPCTTGANERWVYDKETCSAPQCFEPGPTQYFGNVLYKYIGTYRIRSLTNDNMCITIKNSLHVSGQPLLQWDCGAARSADDWEQWTTA